MPTLCSWYSSKIHSFSTATWPPSTNNEYEMSEMKMERERLPTQTPTKRTQFSYRANRLTAKRRSLFLSPQWQAHVSLAVMAQDTSATLHPVEISAEQCRNHVRQHIWQVPWHLPVRLLCDMTQSRPSVPPAKTYNMQQNNSIPCWCMSWQLWHNFQHLDYQYSFSTLNFLFSTVCCKLHML